MSPYTGGTPHGLLEQALERLDEALVRPVDPLIRDAAIKRFEFTFEMAWKAIQAQARREALGCLSLVPNGRIARAAACCIQYSICGS